jgi:hypothetical protein
MSTTPQAPEVLAASSATVPPASVSFSEAQQLATYIGWLMHRTLGGIVAGGLFVLPSLLILIVLYLVRAMSR